MWRKCSQSWTPAESTSAKALGTMPMIGRIVFAALHHYQTKRCQHFPPSCNFRRLLNLRCCGQEACSKQHTRRAAAMIWKNIELTKLCSTISKIAWMLNFDRLLKGTR
eukprot:3192989-Amphidinium_carterae.2